MGIESDQPGLIPGTHLIDIGLCSGFGVVQLAAYIHTSGNIYNQHGRERSHASLFAARHTGLLHDLAILRELDGGRVYTYRLTGRVGHRDIHGHLWKFGIIHLRDLDLRTVRILRERLWYGPQRQDKQQTNR